MLKNSLSKSLLITLLFMLASCVRQPVIIQGKTIDTDSFSQLELGMSQEQVRLILGSPALINTFDSNQWIYYFSNAKINERVIKKQGSLELSFKQNRLENINKKGGLVVTSTDANLEGGTVITKSTQKRRGFLSRIFLN